MTQQKTSERVVFLRKRIAFYEAEENKLPRGVRSSGAGQDEREHYGRMIKSHQAEIENLIEVMAEECVEDYKKQYGDEDAHMQLCLHRFGGE